MKITRMWMKINDYDCIEYELTIPYEKTLVYKNKYGTPTVTEPEKHRLFNIIQKEIPKNETILEKEIWHRENYILARINTKQQKIIETEKIIKQILQEAGYNTEDTYMPITIDQNGWVTLGHIIPLNKKHITITTTILKGTTWQIKDTRDDGALLQIKNPHPTQNTLKNLQKQNKELKDLFSAKEDQRGRIC